MRTRHLPFLFAVAVVFAAGPLGAQTPQNAPAIDRSMYQGLQYRLIGPFRASRTVGAVGVPSQPNVFYVGVVDGGVWKTDDYGRTWKPIFDNESTGSVGDVAVSPSDPNVLYVGTGEGMHRPDLSVGDGVFKSTDGGRTWQHVGLSDVQQIARIIVDPKDPDVVFVAGMGHPYGPNEQRGVFRSRDGGRTWEKVLYVDQNTGAHQVELDFRNRRTLYASLWDHREGPWENGAFAGPNSGLYKSTDGGSSWQKLGGGLPQDAVGRIDFGLSPSDSHRIYASVSARRGRGLYRSDDAGKSWTLMTTDSRVGNDIRVDPENPDLVYSASRGSLRSQDGGRTWIAFKGAPGGDDYQRIWINPQNPDIMLFTADQGATITVNKGRTWSSWYNQPTSQLYHVTTDDQFPYWVYGGQQESGAIGIASRGNGGQISFRDWIGVGADEYGYEAPDPLDPDIVYGGRVMRFDKKTGTAQNVAPEALRSGKYRMLRTEPLLFHPADPHMLLFATNVLWKTTDGGQHWRVISPDLSREQPAVPPSVGDFRTPAMESMARRGVIYAVGPSPLDVNVIWAGTDDGLIHVTRDGGKSWHDVTPPALRSWDKVSQLDAGHFDKATAYAAINAIRRDDMHPYVYRTHDGGATWTPITDGLPAMGPVNVVREDPKHRGLLFAGTERAVYFSIDDGDHWHPLRMNMPATSVRDLVIHDNDLVVGTHGRSIWILDDIAPLRELAAAAAAGGPFVFSPPRATRVRNNVFSGTPLPPEVPTGQNPPPGAVIDYYLPNTAGKVTLEILDGSGKLVRSYASDEELPALDTTAWYYPTYWLRPRRRPSAQSGEHRFVWDLRYPPPRGAERELSISATYHDTPTGPRGPFVHPGRYTVRLTVDSTSIERPLEVRMDPRVSIRPADLRMQTELSMASYRAYNRLQILRDSIDAAMAATSDVALRSAMSRLRGEGKPALPDIQYGSITGAPPDRETIVGLQEKLLYMLELFQSADARPTAQARDAVTQLQDLLPVMERRWASLR